MSFSSRASSRKPANIERDCLHSLSVSIVACTHAIMLRLNSTCSRTCQSRARAMVRLTLWIMEFFKPPGLGFTVPMLATLASAASRACSSGVRSGKGILPAAMPFGLRARTRCLISAITAANSSPLGSSMLPARLFVPMRGDLGVNTTARRELACQRCFHRTAGFHDIAQESIHHVFLKDPQVAIREHIHLERFQFQTQFVRHVAQGELAVIGQA